MQRTTTSAALAILLITALFCTGALSACSEKPGRGGSGIVLAQPAESEQVFGDVSAFAFTERSGAKIARGDLAGVPWVASCIFTRCSGPCPAVTSTMKKLAERLKGSPAKLVTFSVDPEYDTPEVLRQYATTAGADPKRWLFLTGPTAEIDAFVRQSFLSPIERNTAVPIGQQVSHSTRLVVVDKQGRVRGFYSGESDVDLDAIVARVKFLEREPSTPGTSGAAR